MADGSQVISAQREKPEGYVFGRPSAYKPEHCARVIELGQLGYSMARMAADIGVAKQTILNWAKEYPDFLDALSHARTLCQAHWEERGYGGLENKNFNTPLYLGSMKSMFREEYGDRSINEIVGADGGAIQVNDTSIDARKVAFMLGRAVGRAESKPTVELNSIESR